MENSYDQEVVKIGDWVLTLLVSAIPLVGLIMLFVWGFGSGQNQNKANWAKAVLIWQAVLIVITLIFLLLFGAALLTEMN